ncbi:MAG: alpha/beta fold hydrolase [Chloroflexota bacterium]|nr:alpha/beta fold hydrolase [Dehalococcoidia bacterium]MDW8252897.1 alpha/beta fold hydrolase [Chloroflexota bacterium]
MFARVAGVRLGYREAGTGAPLVFLHGWGGDSRSFFPIQHALAPHFRTLALDLPGFGRSALPPAAWGVEEYADHVVGWLDTLGLERASVLGHSFGGRIAIMLAAAYPERVAKLVLVDSAGLVPRRTLGYRLKVRAARLGRRALAAPPLARLRPQLERRFYQLLGASDYAQAGPLRPTFVRVVNQDLRPLLPRIQAPTLIIWGEKDDATPLADGKTMAREIPNARLIVYPYAGHFSYLDAPEQFVADVRAFLAA